LPQTISIDSSVNDESIFDSYLQSDAAGRSAWFDAFLAGLKSIGRMTGHSAAAKWARRAVSVDLDYTSLRALRKFVCFPDGPPDRKRVRLAVLGGPTTIQLAEMINIFAEAIDIPLEIYECDYGLFRQEILSPGSGLDHFQPDIVFLATGARDVSRVPPVVASADDIDRIAEEEFAGWQSLWQTARDRWGAAVIQNTFEIAPWNAMGHYSLRHPASRESYLARLNALFAASAPTHVVLHNLQHLISGIGSREWFDLAFYLEAKLPCGPGCLPFYAHSVTTLVAALRGKSRKVLVLDLDNTLWGGVIGDVGLEGIQLGQGSAQGEAFLYFQAYCKELRDRGILLAVCSKNDDHIARSAFELRDDMILKLEHISCFIANWNNKADNLSEIARRLELGTDSFVFVDDNPAERALVRRFLPEVAVPDMPEDPASYVPALAKHRYFETVSWTEEDAARGELYAQNAARDSMAATFQNLETFLASLGMVAKVEPVHQLNLERVTQLVNKSNQFNLTTRRRTVAEVEKLAVDPEWRSITISLRDQLGDNGLISVIFLRISGDVLEVDTWLMSCRVLQRTVEQLALNEIVGVAQTLGCNVVRGVYIPTERNRMVQDHYAKLGFDAATTAGEATLWSLRVDHSYEERQTHIRVQRGNDYERTSRLLAAGISPGI
jgi:FkbH-like protein